MSPTPPSPAAKSTTTTTTLTQSLSSTSNPNFPPIASSPGASSSTTNTMNFNYIWIPLLIALSKDFTAAIAGKVSSDLLLPSQNHSIFDEHRLGLNCPAVDSKLNYRPVIGILSHPGDGASGRLSNATNASYIAASYVKFIESAGARVIPLIYNEPSENLHMVILRSSRFSSQ